MPVYEYACKACGQHMEVAQSFKDEPLTTCPNCGGQLRKVFGSIGIMFKGSGFYRTDSRIPSGKASGKDKAEKGEKGEKPEKAESSASASSSSSSSADAGSGSGSGGSSDSSSGSERPKTSGDSPAKSAAKTA